MMELTSGYTARGDLLKFNCNKSDKGEKFWPTWNLKEGTISLKCALFYLKIDRYWSWWWSLMENLTQLMTTTVKKIVHVLTKYRKIVYLEITVCRQLFKRKTGFFTKFEEYSCTLHKIKTEFLSYTMNPGERLLIYFLAYWVICQIKTKLYRKNKRSADSTRCLLYLYRVIFFYFYFLFYDLIFLGRGDT